MTRADEITEPTVIDVKPTTTRISVEPTHTLIEIHTDTDADDNA